jgi:hypothetical protein
MKAQVRRPRGSDHRARLRLAASGILSRPGSATSGPDVPVPRTAAAGGIAGLLLAIAAWAYAVAALTPRMPTVGQRTPMPGDEIILWVAELRWGAILLAALALLCAAADRPAAPAASAILAVLLIGFDAGLARSDADGTGGLVAAVALGAVAAGIAWWVAGLPDRGHASRVRHRLSFAAITAAFCGPLLLRQGTPDVNHPFLPLGLPVLTVVVAVALTTLAAAAVVSARHRPPPRVIAVLLALVPALWGVGTYLSTPGRQVSTSLGVPAALLLAVVVVAVLYRHPARRGGVTAGLWAAVALAGVLASGLVVAVGAYLLGFVPGILFEVGGSSYPADGVSLLPGAALLGMVVAAQVAQWIGRADGTSGPVQAPAAVPAALVPAATVE